MAEEVATIVTTGVAVIGCLGVGIVRDYKCVVVLSLAWVCCDDWGSVIHSFADFRQCVLFEPLFILLLFIDRLKSLLHRFIVIAGIIIALSEEALAG
jgi:hypothetical protein